MAMENIYVSLLTKSIILLVVIQKYVLFLTRDTVVIVTISLWETPIWEALAVITATDTHTVHKLICHSGTTINIKDMRFEFFEDARVIVEPGAKLNLNNNFEVPEVDAD